MNFKFSAMAVDEIEKSLQAPIENCVTDSRLNTLALFVQKGFVNDEGKVGVSRNIAMTTIEDYLKEHDKDELMWDIIESLVGDGFLSHSLDVSKLRAATGERKETVSRQLESI